MTQAKILTVTPFFRPNVGGIASHVLNLNANLIKNGYDISIITSKHLLDNATYVDPDFKQFFRVNSIYLPGWPYPTLRSVSIPYDFGRRISEIIKNGNFDIVHVHGYHYPISWMAINSAKKHRIPSVLTMHGMYSLNPNAMGGKSIIEDIINKTVISKIISKTTGVIGLTEAITNHAKQLGSKSQQYFTIPNGADTTIYKQNISRKKEFRKRHDIGENKIVILFCGRFEKVKGIIEFANAARKLVRDRHDVEVVIVGHGSLESAVHLIVDNVDGIHLSKWVPANLIHEYYILSDIFVIPSRFEGLPLTIIEAMNAGLHIVYTPVGGMPEVLKDYTVKTTLQKISIDEIHDVLQTLTSDLPTAQIKDSLAYAQKFDWSDISIETGRVYDRCFIGG